MRFALQADDEIEFEFPGGRLTLAAAPHPDFQKGDDPSLRIAHASSGDRSTVYHLIDRQRGLDYALKIFKDGHHEGAERNERLAEIAAFVRGLRMGEGLACCDRICLTPENAGPTLARYPALGFSHLMPWLEGTTWFDVHQRHETVRTLTPWHCLQIATSFTGTLAILEDWGIAHCNLNPVDILVDTAPRRMRVELLGIEDLWSPRLREEGRRREPVPEYAHPLDTAPCLWSDRFPGALLIAEMLAWHSEEVTSEFQHQAESLFTVEELAARSSPKLPAVRWALQRHGLNIWALFLRAWESASMSGCPSLEEWHAALQQVGREKIEYAWRRPPPRAAPMTLSIPQAVGAVK